MALEREAQGLAALLVDQECRDFRVRHPRCLVVTEPAQQVVEVVGGSGNEVLRENVVFQNIMAFPSIRRNRRWAWIQRFDASGMTWSG